MRRLIVVLIVVAMTAVSAHAGGGLVYTKNYNSAIQAFAPDPVKCVGTKAANTVFMVGSGGDVNIADWLAICFWPTADGQIALNNDGTKTIPIYSGRPNVIIVHPNVTQIVPSVSAVVCGM